MTNQELVLENRCLKLTHAIDDLVIGRSRDLASVAGVLQVVKDEPNFDQILRAPAESAQDTEAIRKELVEWEKFDRRFFPEFVRSPYSGLRMPKPLPGDNWPIVTLPGLTMNTVVERMRKELRVVTYRDDLDRNVFSDRMAVSMPRLTLVRARVEADEELKAKSAETLAAEQVVCTTFPETLRLFFFKWSQGVKLDEHTATLCAGSRRLDGDVPSAGWRGGGFYVYYYYPQGAHSNIRARAASSV